MTAMAWPVEFADGLDEDEVLLAWLKASYSMLSAAERRAAVRRLSTEFGYTSTGLARELGLSDTRVRQMRASDEQIERERAMKRVQARRTPKVSGRRVLALADRWQERAAAGLDAADAARLLAEFRALVPPRP